MIVYLNGKWVAEKKAAIPITDHGFLYGDGVYETIRIYNGKPFLLGEHLRRLNNSMRGIRLTPPMSLINFGLAIQKTIEANKHKEAVVRLTITRGPGEHGFDPALCRTPTVLITSKPVKPYPAEDYKKGILAAVVSVRRNASNALPPSIKSTSCLNGILAKIESIEMGAREAILLAQDKALTEGTVSNIFITQKHTLFTPRLEDGLLPGVTRDWVCALARQAGYKVEQQKLRLADLTSADEMFLTSTVMEIMPVSRLAIQGQLNDKPLRFGPYAKTSGLVGPVTLDLMKRFRASVQRFARI